MTTHVSTDFTDYQKMLNEANDCSGEEKLQRLIKVQEAIKRFELHAVTNFDIPFYTVKKVKDLVPEVQSSINRLVAAKRKKSET